MNANKIISYIMSSIATVVEASHSPMYMEGEIDDPFSFNNDVEYELRINDFRFNTSTKDNHRVVFEVDVLVKVKMSTEQPYLLKDYLGQVVSTLSGMIPINKYGPDPGDDESTIDCLKREGEILADDLGQVKADVNAVFGHVTANYSLTWSE